MKRVAISALTLWALVDAGITFHQAIGAPLWLKLALSLMSLCDSAIFIGLLFLAARWVSTRLRRYLDSHIPSGDRTV